MFTSSELRQRRKVRQRHKIRFVSSGTKMNSKKLRLCVHRTHHHIYAQIIDDSQGKTLLSVSTLSIDSKKDFSSGGNKEASVCVGKEIAQKALSQGIKTVVFDRSGFLYHGRIKSLADAAREHGLLF